MAQGKNLEIEPFGKKTFKRDEKKYESSSLAQKKRYSH
jgi:hypothetical protein